MAFFCWRKQLNLFCSHFDGSSFLFFLFIIFIQNFKNTQTFHVTCLAYFFPYYVGKKISWTCCISLSNLGCTYELIEAKVLLKHIVPLFWIVMEHKQCGTFEKKAQRLFPCQNHFQPFALISNQVSHFKHFSESKNQCFLESLKKDFCFSGNPKSMHGRG